MSDQLIEWVISRLIDWVSDWLTDWLSYWVISNQQVHAVFADAIGASGYEPKWPAPRQSHAPFPHSPPRNRNTGQRIRRRKTPKGSQIVRGRLLHFPPATLLRHGLHRSQKSHRPWGIEEGGFGPGSAVAVAEEGADRRVARAAVDGVFAAPKRPGLGRDAHGLLLAVCRAYAHGGGAFGAQCGGATRAHGAGADMVAGVCRLCFSRLPWRVGWSD